LFPDVGGNPPQVVGSRSVDRCRRSYGQSGVLKTIKFGGNIMETYSAKSTSYAEKVFSGAGELGAVRKVHQFFGLTSAVQPVAVGAPSSSDLNNMLN
jgi:hypothetical protein